MSLMDTPVISSSQAEQIGRRPDLLKEDEPPMLRFVETTVEDRNASLATGRFIHRPVIKVYIRARGDTKCEVPDIVRGWKTEEKLVDREVTRKVYRHEPDGNGNIREVEREITETIQEPYQYQVESTPWLDKLAERLHHGRISQRYYDYCVNSFHAWEEKRQLPVEGTPINGWNQISMAQQRNLIDLGINSIELAAEMTEEAMAAFGMGARQVKKLAQAYLAVTDTGQAATRISVLEQDNENLKARNDEMSHQLTAFEQKIRELESRVQGEQAAAAGAPPSTSMADDGINLDDDDELDTEGEQEEVQEDEGRRRPRRNRR